MGYLLPQIHSAIHIPHSKFKFNGGKSKFTAAISNSPWQIQIRHGKFKFTASNSNSLRQFQILHGQIKIYNGKLKFATA